MVLQNSAKARGQKWCQKAIVTRAYRRPPVLEDECREESEWTERFSVGDGYEDAPSGCVMAACGSNGRRRPCCFCSTMWHGERSGKEGNSSRQMSPRVQLSRGKQREGAVCSKSYA